MIPEFYAIYKGEAQIEVPKLVRYDRESSRA